MRGVSATAALALLLALAAATAAQAGGGEPAAEVNAEGNPFSGGLGFDPDDVTVAVGDVVRWTNTDALVPHTATEDNRLWRRAGDYGADPFPRGFGPGESRKRVFDAGTFGYFCEVHPQEMTGFVRVPVTVQDRAGGVRVKWGAQQLPDGQAFDVQRRQGDGWRLVRDATTRLAAKFDGGGDFRARLRLADDRDTAAGWSPPASG